MDVYVKWVLRNVTTGKVLFSSHNKNRIESLLHRVKIVFPKYEYKIEKKEIAIGR